MTFSRSWLFAGLLSATWLLVADSSAADDPQQSVDESTATDSSVDGFATEVNQLVFDLGADQQSTRTAAREQLLELAGTTQATGERLLAALPKPVEQMPAAVRTALQKIRRTIADRVAKLAVSESRVSIDVVEEPLSEVLRSIEEQTGNQVIDLRDQFGQQADDRPVTLELTDVPFWEAVDQVLDEAGLGVYSFSGESALALVAREPGATPRWARADYAGPLRIEPIRVTAARDLRQVGGESLNLQLEISWEPRLAPIAFSQPLTEVEAENEKGDRLSMARPERSIDLEVQPGGQTLEMTLPLLLPTRQTSLIATLQGKLQAIVPGRQAEFRFDDLTDAKKPISQQEGGATVSLIDMRKVNDIWELHMRLKLDGASGEGGADDTFASHRGWVFNNPTFLVGDDDEPIDHAGFETTMQRGNEIGLAYLFDLPDGPESLTWVYKTPTAIVRFPVTYELSHIPLP
ncbi:MAG: hypothetical protein AAGF31_12180 [Planctomycetota bacterium]